MLVHEGKNNSGSFTFNAEDIQTLYRHQVEQLTRPHAMATRSRTEIKRFMALLQKRLQLLLTLPTQEVWDWKLLSTREPEFLLGNLLSHKIGRCQCPTCQTQYLVADLKVYEWQGGDPTWREYQCPAEHTLYQHILLLGELFENAKSVRVQAVVLCRCAELWYG